MTRTYTLGKRAEQQADTRRRIVEAAVALHTEVGPARTTFSMVAERAGVQRNTFYSHFPDERTLLLACSALSLERDPLPDADAWRAIRDRNERLSTGLSALYAWYERNADLTGCVLRDADAQPLVREIVELRWAPYHVAYDEVLSEGLGAPARALLRLALDFFTWRSLVRDSGLTPEHAVRTMVTAISAAR
ncbi:TetR/AcrR family transcriptional regulator [Lysobacter sp. KIS68-7]|uniref:TetR/AcrR family transcriptional regulator n=1 Tax=Lysobacter sp. KIS68-7 TaxID=2904252 RepID=UPI001E2D78E2|nr:TetR/AcrR family transcriptional regulator [Lysobacter sp. KIS68-7]UHQ18271.1 TetR/AcrR family transcriptional regulator [Lysobacter sp. KIS68-7]